jgi:hypothetical protein
MYDQLSTDYDRFVDWQATVRRDPLHNRKITRFSCQNHP